MATATWIGPGRRRVVLAAGTVVVLVAAGIAADFCGQDVSALC
jgi:hypothetical protein